MGGFRGCISLEPSNICYQNYKQLIEFMDQQQEFHSVIATSIVAAAEGWFGNSNVPTPVKSRVRSGRLYIWPLMAQMWAFDIDTIVNRSFIIPAIRKAETVPEMTLLFNDIIRGKRQAEKRKIVSSPETIEADIIPQEFSRRPIENLPKHEDFSIRRK